MIVVGLFGLDSLWQSIVNFFFDIFYGIDIIVCELLDILYSLFEVFVGVEPVSLNGNSNYLLDVFFGNSTISKLYWGMALIGIVLAFAFSMIGVIKKIFDADEKVKSNIGGIIRKLIQSILMILLMNFGILVVLNGTNLLTQQVTLLFNNTEILGQAKSYTFTTADYATMARIYDKIGNYSLNDSRTSRYNVNACFNDIRLDLQSLQNRGVFDFTYPENSWQGVLKKIAFCHDLNTEQNLDDANKELGEAVENAMVTLETYRGFKPEEKATRESFKMTAQRIPIDVIVFQMGMLEHAKNNEYNKSPSLYDSLRYDYITQKKSIYSLDTVRRDFDINNMGCHILIITSGLLIAWEFLKIVLNCVARIFNIILLYISFPPFAATLPMDEGAKLKQWITAFIIQSLSVFGTLLGVRLLMIIIPIIFNSDLVLFEGSFMNMLAKLVFLIGLSFTTEKASAMITGVLADQAGYQAVQASSAGAANAMSVAKAGAAIGQKSFGILSKPAGAVLGGAKKVVGGAASIAWDKTGGRLKDKAADSRFGRNLRQFGGKVSNKFSGWSPVKNASDNRKKMRAQDQLRKDLKQGGEAGKKARENLFAMDGKTASDKYGMSSQDLNRMKMKTGLSDKKDKRNYDNAKSVLSGIQNKKDAKNNFGMSMKEVNSLRKEHGLGEISEKDNAGGNDTGDNNASNPTNLNTGGNNASNSTNQNTGAGSSNGASSESSNNSRAEQVPTRKRRNAVTKKDAPQNMRDRK